MRSVLILGLLSFALVTPFCQAADLDLNALYAETGAALIETEFQAWLLMDADYNDIPVDKLLAQVATDFGYQVRGSIEQSNFQENFQQAFALIDFFEADGWLTIQRMQNLTLSGSVETFIGLRAVHQGGWPGLPPYRERVASEYQSLGLTSDIQFFTTLIGTTQGKLLPQARQTIVDRIAAMAQASPVDTFTQGELVTFSFLSPNLPDRLQTGTKQMNLHLAFRYNEFEGQTYVYLGTPIIAPDY